MAFFRFTRDKRGYQNFYLVEPIANRRGKVRQRVLYWFRSPPDIKVGREPFDESVRRALEAQNPDVTFDWRSILEAPIPSADAEKWRERRRAERAAKQAQASSAVEDEGDEPDEPAGAAGEAAGAVGEPEPESSSPVAAQSAASAPSAGENLRRKRRRRRGKRPPTSTPAGEPVAPQDETAMDEPPAVDETSEE